MGLPKGSGFGVKWDAGRSEVGRLRGAVFGEEVDTVIIEVRERHRNEHRTKQTNTFLCRDEFESEVKLKLLLLHESHDNLEHPPPHFLLLFAAFVIA